MKLWTWFCRLGAAADHEVLHFFPAKPPAQASPPAVISGSETACTRLCGQSGCRCGGTIRGLHCVWSHYRMQ